MICVVSAFSLCWMPLNVYNLLMMIDGPTVNSSPYAEYVYFGCHWLAMSHTCYNPLIYCWLNAKFRQGFTRLFCSRTARRSQRRNTYTSYVSCNNQHLQQQLHMANTQDVNLANTNHQFLLHQCNNIGDFHQIRNNHDGSNNQLEDMNNLNRSSRHGKHKQHPMLHESLVDNSEL